MYEREIRRGFTYQYYLDIVKGLKDIYPDVSIKIVCENSNIKDIAPLHQEKGVILDIGNTIEHDFHSLCSADILISSKSGFSTMAAYLCNGITCYDTHIPSRRYCEHFIQSDHDDVSTEYILYDTPRDLINTLEHRE